MTELPTPFVPADVDLRGLGYMPFWGHHLLGSEFHARCDDSSWRAGVTLWWAAWNQVPAASLPDDDVALCRLADLGRDIKTWQKLRAAGALHGYVKCSDGRLYHKFLAQQALVAWDKRVQDRARKEAWRVANRAKKAGTEPSVDADRDVSETGTGRGQDSPGDGDRTGTVTGQNSPVPAPGRSDGTGREVTGRDGTPPISPPAGEAGTVGAQGREKKGNQMVVRVPDWVPPDAWEDYRAMRTRIRKPMTDRAAQLAIGLLDKLRAQGHDPSAVLEQSVLNAWQGLFPLKAANGARNGVDHYAATRANAARAKELIFGKQPGEVDGEAERV